MGYFDHTLKLLRLPTVPGGGMGGFWMFSGLWMSINCWGGGLVASCD